MSVIDEVKARIDIVDVISESVDLRKSGRNYKALCPFHSEKTPSFVVFPDSQRWHCFGACNEGGDVFSFVMKHDGWDFRMALEELAQRAGVELQPRTPEQAQAAEEADRLRDILDTASQYYHHLLRHAPEADGARSYVDKRNLSDETVEEFQLGYSLSGWNRARDYLTERGYAVDDLVKAGLLVEREGGGTYDRFRGRLMIPIRDQRGRVIGFGARTLDPDGVPKYLNSPQTALFDKSTVLFGLDLARRAIRREDRVVIVEGYMDVMQAHQAGFENIVAQMGTALTEPQLKQLQRYSKRIVLSLDPDAAGVRATLRGVEVASDTLEQEWEPVFDPRGLVGYEGRLGAELRVLRLPPGQDPDDLIRQDAQRWLTLVEEAVPVVDFYLHILIEGIDLEDTKAKARVVDKMLPVLKAVANPVEREDYVQKIARALRVGERAVLSRLRSKKAPVGRAGRRGRERRQDRENGRDGEPKRDGVRDVIIELGEHCLSLLLQRPSLLSQVNRALRERELEPLRIKDFQDAGHRAILEAWKELLDSRPSVSSDMLREVLPSGLEEQLDALLNPGEVEFSLSSKGGSELLGKNNSPGLEGWAEEQLVRDAVLTLLRLRERHLRQLGQELSFLTREAQDAGDMRAEEYAMAWLSHTATLRQTQRALAQSWGQVG
jgi:DNA primase